MRSSRSLQSSHVLGPSTSLPFLYETRTIAGAGRLALLTRSTLSAPRICAYSSMIIRRVAVVPKDFPERGPYTEKDLRFRSIARNDGDEFESAPTRDTLRTRFTAGRNDHDKQDLEFGGRKYVPNGEASELDVREDWESENRPVLGRPSKDSTITVAEKQTFDQIFESIRSRSTRYRAELGSEDDYSALGEHDSQKSGQTLEAILDQVWETEVQPFPRRSGRQSSFSERQEIESAINSYPEILRVGAAKALKAKAHTFANDRGSGEQSLSDRLEQLRQPERERIEALMRSANTDIQLWNVMEEEVFPMIKHLGLVDPPSSTKPQLRYTVDPTLEQKAAERLAKTRASMNLEPTPKLDINIHGPLYPAHVLLGLRLLDRGFQKPSPLVLSVLPRIKSLGIMSQALGASTALYNELLRITWQRYDDLPTVLSLLSEMEAAGLDLNADTRDILAEMITMYQSAKRGDDGTLLKNFYNMPSFATAGDLRAWRHKCLESINERAKELEQDLEWDPERA